MQDWFQVSLRLSIACLTLVGGAIAVDAAPQNQNNPSKNNPSKNYQAKQNQARNNQAQSPTKVQNKSQTKPQAKSQAKPLNKPQTKQQIVKPAPVAKKSEDSAVNQAKYLRLDPQINSQKSIFLAQETSDSNLRKNLKIDPLPTVTPPAVNAPSLGFGIPSAFGASWGDAFISAAIATAGKSRDGQVDGSISTGFGVGDARNAVGLEVVYNVGSIKNFGSNGTFDAKLHRVVYSEGATQIAVAAGWDAFAQYGNEGVRPSSAYGAVSSYTLLQPDDSFNKMPISFTLGVGGGNFRKGNASTGVFGGVGLQVHPQVGVGAAWSGVGLNLGVSYVPVSSIPLTLSISGLDLTDNSVGGRVLLFGVSYGFNFLPTK